MGVFFEKDCLMAYKLVVILSAKLEVGRALNAASHMAAALVAEANTEQKQSMMFVDYQDADQNVHPVSGLSLVVLKAKNGNQIRTARENAKAAGLHCVDFVETMTDGTTQEQME